MKEIECPSCGEMIPEDSKYCDMCGIELLECVNCGSLGTDQFCTECGNPMVARRTDKPTPKKEEPVKTPVAGGPAGDTGKTPGEGKKDTDGGKTVGGRRKSLVLRARTSGGVIRPQHEALIGRKEGPYTTVLAECDLISRKHGKFMQRGRDWYIIDFGSTNGTYVNDREVPANTPVKIAVGDMVDIGTLIFDVIEQ